MIKWVYRTHFHKPQLIIRYVVSLQLHVLHTCRTTDDFRHILPSFSICGIKDYGKLRPIFSIMDKLINHHFPCSIILHGLPLDSFFSGPGMEWDSHSFWVEGLSPPLHLHPWRPNCQGWANFGLASVDFMTFRYLWLMLSICWMECVETKFRPYTK